VASSINRYSSSWFATYFYITKTVLFWIIIQNKYQKQSLTRKNILTKFPSQDVRNLFGQLIHFLTPINYQGQTKVVNLIEWKI